MGVHLSQVKIVTVDTLPTFERDPNDAHVLATAVQGGVDYLISADTNLLDLGEYAGLPILSTGTFLRLLEQAQLNQ